MALTTAERVRLIVQDQPLRADLTMYGDGTAAKFALPHRNLQSGTAFVPLGGTAWSATGCTFDASGHVAFSGVISANSAWRAEYVYNVFSDAEIGQFTADGGSVSGAAQQAVMALMFDSLKRAVWRAPDGSMYDDVAAMGQLRTLYDMLASAQANDALVGGAIYGWSETQGDY